MGPATLGLVAALAAAAATPPAEAEPALQQWGAITMFHGLPSPRVRAIAQDGDGILWFGTDAGLVRYDGLRLERAPLGRTPVAVRALAVGPEGTLWAGTDAGAFVRLSEVFTPVPETADHPINAILADADGVVLASEQGAVFTCTLGADGAVATASLGSEDAGLLRDRNRRPMALMALGRRGPTLLAGTRGRGLLSIRAAIVEEMDDPGRPFFVTAVAADAAGRAFLGAETNPTGRGVFVLEGGRARALDAGTGSVSALTFDAGGDLWVGTRERGLVRIRNERAIDKVTFETSGGALHSNRVLAVFADRDSVLWIGTDRGVCRYDPRGPRAERVGDTPRSNFVHALLSTKDGRLWAGTQRGLFVRTTGGGWQQVTALGGHTIHALAETDDGRLLAGTPTGLHASLAGSDSWEAASRSATTSPGESVRAIQVLGGTAYLATFGRGMERLVGSERVTLWPAPDADAALRQVVSLAVVNETIWIGTASAGTFIFRGESALRDPELSNLGTLRAVTPDGEGGLWIGTDRGLFRRTNDRLEPLASGHDVRALLRAEGPTPSVWCATTDSGILRVAVTPSVGAVTSRLGTDYGLPSDAVYAMAALPGQAREVSLVVGTNRGVAFYEPGRVPPRLRFLRVLGRESYARDTWATLRLEYPQSSLLVEAAAIGNRTYPEHFQYVFTLSTREGRPLRSRLSRDGQFSTDSLSPGGYCLEARSLDVDLRASAPASLCFDVARAPLPWTSISLGVLLGGALLALVWGYRQNRRLLDTNVVLSETRLQLVQETENERRRIARDLHDQTLADLRRLLLLAPPFRAAVESISTEVRRICEDLSPSVLANVGLTPALEWALDEGVRHLPPDQACRATFSCSRDVEERLSLDGAVEIQIYRMVQEALSNAVRHARATTVRLTVTLDGDGVLEIAVEDDGCGFDARQGTQGRGLANLRSRANLIGATIDWSPRPGGGTVFRLRKAGSAGPARP